MAQQLEIPLPEITVEDFERAWIRFDLVAAAKKWDNAKQLAIVPALLPGKLVDFFVELTSVIRHNTLPQSVLSHMEPASVAAVGANGLLDVAGQVSVLVSLGNYCVQHTFLVVHGLTVEGLLGADFLDKH